MKLSGMELDLIKPQLINNLKGFRAFFTCKNTGFQPDGQKIPGLNFGYNTDEQKKVVQSNRVSLLNHLDIDPAHIAYANQVHGNRVQVVSEGGTYGETDALVTQVPGLALAIQVADCAVVLLADDTQKIAGAVHAGWRGAAGDILPKTVEQMRRLGAEENNLKAFISPCISLNHFEVGEEVADQFPDRFVDYEGFKKPHIDLKAFLNYQMLEMGIEEMHVEIHEGCTVADEDRYYSYRREQQQSGRMLGIIQMER